jgi:hypothetical protein
LESAASTRLAGLGEGKVKVQAFLTYFTPGYPLPQLNILAGPEHEVEVRGFVDVRMDAVGEWGEEDPGAFMAKGAVEQLKLRTCTAGDVVLAWNSDKVGLYTDADCEEEDKVLEDEGSVVRSRRATFSPEYPTAADRDMWGANFRRTDLYAKGMEASDVPRDINLSLAPVSGKAALDLVNLSVVEMGLETVKFSGDGLDGIPMQDHYKDKDGDNQRDPDEDYVDNDISVAPEWVADDVDVDLPTWLKDHPPDADDQPERNKHALIPRNTKFRVKAVFSLEGIDFRAGEVCAWASCENDDLALGTEETPVILQKVGDKWEGTFQIRKAPSTSGVLDGFTWSWHIKLRGQVACASSTSTHTVFVSWDDPPAAYKFYDWVAWWSCEWGSHSRAPGETDAEARKKILENIYDNLPNTGTTGPSQGLRYEYPSPVEESVRSLLVTGEGRCGAWSDFLIDLGAIHTAGFAKCGWSLRGDYPPESDVEREERAAAFMLAAGTKDVDGSNGIGGENPVPNRFAFQDHAFVAYGHPLPGDEEEYEFFIYDPSFRNSRFAYDDLAGNLPERFEYLEDFRTKCEFVYFIHVTKEVAYDNQPGDNWPSHPEYDQDIVDWIPTTDMTHYPCPPNPDTNFKVVVFDPDHPEEEEHDNILHKGDF